MPRVEVTFVDEYKSRTILDRSSHEKSEHFSIQHNIRSQGIDWADLWFAPAEVQVVLQDFADLPAIDHASILVEV